MNDVDRFLIEIALWLIGQVMVALAIWTRLKTELVLLREQFNKLEERFNRHMDWQDRTIG